MNQIEWLSFGEASNSFGGSSMGCDVAAFFMRRFNYKITSLYDDKKSLLWDNEEPKWVDPNKDALQVQWLYEQIIEDSNVIHLEADLFPNGKVYMSGGHLHIKVPKDVPIRPFVKHILDYNGYVAADQILDFLDYRYPQSFFIQIAKGIKPQDLTDQFARMVEHNVEIEKNDREYERLANEELTSHSRDSIENLFSAENNSESENDIPF
jgi:hypothetical protein